MNRPRKIILILLETLITVTAGVLILCRMINVFIILAVFAVLGATVALITIGNSKCLSDKPTKPGLVLAVIVEFWIIVFYPLVFLYFKPMRDIPRYPEFSRHYESGTMYVVLKKNLNYTNYHNNTTGENSDGTKLRVPKGSKVEVAIVDMKDYPEQPAQITTCFYDCESGCYTLWGGVKLDWIENPEVITNDLDAVRAEEKRLKRDTTIITYSGLAAAVNGAAGIVFLIWLLLKEHKEYHLVLAASLVLLNVLVSFLIPGLSSYVRYTISIALMFLFI